MSDTNDTLADAGIQIVDTADAKEELDGFVIPVGTTCELYTGERLDEIRDRIDEVRGNMSGEIIKVLAGKCDIIIPPAITKECSQGGAFPADSAIHLKSGIIAVTPSEEGYNQYSLLQGKAVYDAVKGVCDVYPDTNVRVMGYKLKPTGDSGGTEFDIRTGNIPIDRLAKVYMISGSGDVYSADGQQMIGRLIEEGGIAIDSKGNVVANVDSEGNIITDFGTQEMPLKDALVLGNGEADSAVEDMTCCETRVPVGCNSSPVSLNKVSPSDALMIIIAMVGARLAALIRNGVNKTLGK